MVDYVNLFTSIVKNNARYTLNGNRIASGYLRKNLPYILEKLPENTPNDVYTKLVQFADNPKCTIYTAGVQLNKIMSVEQKAKNVLSDFYKKVMIKAKNEGNIKRANCFEQCRNNIGNLDTAQTYQNLLEAIYKDLRIAEYPMHNLKNVNIDKITGVGNSIIRVKNQNGWHYRIPVARQKNNTIDRISVNAIADENLIKSLDNLFGTGKVKGYYKTPDLSSNWLERHDPVTIYLDEKATPEILDKVKKACEKYIRSNDDVLIGTKFAPGFALQKSPTPSDIEALLKRMKIVDTELENVIRAEFTNRQTGNLVTSAGYMEAANKMLSLLQ